MAFEMVGPYLPAKVKVIWDWEAFTSGNNYLIRLGGWDDTSTGTGTLSISCD